MRYRKLFGMSVYFPPTIKLSMSAVIDEARFCLRFDIRDTFRCEKVEVLGLYEYTGAKAWRRDRRQIVISLPYYNGLIADLLGDLVFDGKQEAKDAASLIIHFRNRAEMAQEFHCTKRQTKAVARMLIGNWKRDEILAIMAWHLPEKEWLISHCDIKPTVDLTQLRKAVSAILRGYCHEDMRIACEVVSLSEMLFSDLGRAVSSWLRWKKKGWSGVLLDQYVVAPRSDKKKHWLLDDWLALLSRLYQRALRKGVKEDKQLISA